MYFIRLLLGLEVKEVVTLLTPLSALYYEKQHSRVISQNLKKKKKKKIFSSYLPSHLGIFERKIVVDTYDRVEKHM